MRMALGLVVAGLAVLLVSGSSPERPAAAAEPTSAAAGDGSAAKEVSFKDDVMPILSANCIGCHGGKKKKAGVDLESYAGVMKVVQAGKPDQSRLVKSLVGKGAKQMPPKSSLEEKDVELIKGWVAAGAKNN
jgi:mono/diheme cytochrome c family protein